MDNSNTTQTIKDRYRLDGLLGQGGLGTTYYCYDLYENEYVALKEINDEVKEKNNAFIERLLSLELPSAGLVHIRDFFAYDNKYYMVMDYIEGANALSYFELYRDQLTVEQILYLMRDVILAVSDLNNMGIVHGDVSTDNIVINMNNTGVLVDLPITDLASRVKKGFSPIELYFYPSKADSSTDVYGICATLYHMLTGEIPTDSYDISSGEAIRNISEIRNDLPEYISNAIMCGLSFDKSKRFESVAALFDALYNGSQKAYISPVIENNSSISCERAAASAPYIAKAEMNTFDPKNMVRHENTPLENIKELKKTGAEKSKQKRMIAAMSIIVVILAILGVSIGFYVDGNSKRDRDRKASETDASEAAEQLSEELSEQEALLSEQLSEQEAQLSEELAEQQAQLEQQYAANMELYVAAVEEINYPSSWEAADEAVHTLMSLGDFEDSKQILFGAAYKYLDEYDNYEKAQEIYDYLGSDVDSDGISGDEWAKECIIRRGYDYYCDKNYRKAKEEFDLIHPYTSRLDSSMSTEYYMDTVIYNIAILNVDEEISSEYEAAESLFWEHNDFDNIEYLAGKYIKLHNYEKATSLYMTLAQKTGASYEEQIQNCQISENMYKKYSLYSPESSTMYDEQTETVVAYVDSSNIEKYLKQIYTTYYTQDGTTLEFTLFEINGRRYAIKRIDINTKNNTIYTITYAYLDEPDIEHQMVYCATVSYTQVDSSGYEHNDYHDTIMIDQDNNTIYANEW